MFLSFIIPVYNREHLIGRCLDSILKQNANDIEIICIDDASTDNTSKVIDEYQKNYLNIKKITNKKNCGQAYARNCGMELAQGDYIWFVDSDDYILDDAIECIRHYYDKEEIDYLCFDIYRISDRGKMLDSINISKTEEIISGQELFCEFASVKSIKASTCKQIYSRSFLERINLKFTVGYIAEDAFFNLKSLVLATKAMYVKIPFYVYQISDNSTGMYAIEKDYFKGFFMAYCDIWQFWQSQKWEKQVSEYIAGYMVKEYGCLSKYYAPNIRKEMDDWIEEQSEIAKNLYILFKEQTLGYYIRDLSEAQYLQIKTAKDIYVYGAGRVAYEMANILNQMEKQVLSYLVSDYTSENPKAIYGVSVTKIGELDNISKEALVIIAALPRYYDGIIKILQKNGMNNVLKVIE